MIDADGLRQQNVDDQEYTEVMDESSHHYYIPIARYADFQKWVYECDDTIENHKCWEEPDYAVRIDGGHLIFKAPRIGSLD